MQKEFSYRPSARVVVQYRQGKTYPRVPEATVREILAAGAGAGVIVDQAANQ
ncbi:hypothetical protein [Bradyrhizobium japonicum]|uniref:hypothetical protein n=2 Tax=Bradyrhizobium TaxID=374 RepID=UPI0020A01D23|nr:hypothetical protein [Bradyrhizobium japonicum]MCP1779855.1 hypothetical protein [Bradyrhizobium japonicum]